MLTTAWKHIQLSDAEPYEVASPSGRPTLHMEGLERTQLEPAEEIRLGSRRQPPPFTLGSCQEELLIPTLTNLWLSISYCGTQYKPRPAPKVERSALREQAGDQGQQLLAMGGNMGTNCG